MGLIKAAAKAAGGVLADQWKDYFYCEALTSDVLMARGVRRNSSHNNNGGANIITNGSMLVVADGQCAIIVDQGKVADLCAVPGEYTYDQSSEPSLFTGNLSQSIGEVFKNIGKRFTFGGEAPKDQRIYYVNTKELTGNKYGTPNPVPFRVVDAHAGIDMDISIRCFGEYSYRITNPVLFYTNVAGNVTDTFNRDQIDGQLKSELLTALQPVFAKLSDQGIRYSSLPGHTEEMAEAMNSVLSAKWANLRGVEVVSMGVSSVKASEEDEATIKQMQKDAAYTNTNLRSAAMAGATMDAMRDAAKNQSGAAVSFMGMNMAQGFGAANMNAAQAAEAAQPAQNSLDSWTCSCGAANTGKFCSECGKPKPAGKVKCPNCGYEPADGSKPKFCPECGKPMA